MFFDCLLMRTNFLVSRFTALSFVVALLMALLLASCRGNEAGHHGDDDRYAGLDSVMATIGDVDSLEALVNQCHQQHDVMGEMLALRYQGRKLREMARYAEAIAAHTRSVELAVGCCDTIEIANSLFNLGEDYRRQGNLSQANGCYFQVLKISDHYSNNEAISLIGIMARTLNGVGKIALEMSNYDLADSVFREAIKREELLGNDDGLAANYGALGRVKHAMNDLDSAWFYQRKSMDYHSKSNNLMGIALCHLHYGELYESEHRFAHAIGEYTQAYNGLEATGDKWHWLDACLALARANILLGEEEAARDFLTRAEAVAQEIGSKEDQAEAHLVHYQFSLLQGDPQEALHHYVMGTELMDSIHGRSQGEEIHRQHVDFQNHRMSGEVDVLSRDLSDLKRERNLQLALGLLMLLMAVAVIVALTYVVRVRARTQQLMRQVEETRSLFFTNVVHQLRTPLTAIMGAVDTIMAQDKQTATGQGSADTESSVRKENYEIIERQGNNLLALVDRILEVGDVRSTITELEWRQCDAVTLMHMVLESYRERCLERHIELTYAPHESNVDIVTVPRYLVTIISSLMDNAINYSNEFGKITVTSHVDDGMFVIKVADSGIGISKEDLPHVFEPFYRSAAVEARIGGVGIGLTVVRDMTMAMHGIVAADSKKDHGSVFTVKLPCRQGQGVKQQFDEAVEPFINKIKGRLQYHQQDNTAQSAPQHEGQPVVLVVEDHTDVAYLVGLVLGEEYSVYYATDGEQGLAKANELRPDLIISDVKMPIMDGIEFCRKLRQSQWLCHIPVIMLSARNSDTDRVRGLRAGADAYLVKPFVSEELRAWVARLLESRQTMRDLIAATTTATTTAQAVQPSHSRGATVADDAKFLDDFAREVEKQFDGGGKIDLDVVARTFKMGESQMRRKVQSLTGKTVPAYIIQLRMEKAMRLLINSKPDTLIGTISEQCGFQDVAYFSRVFRQHYGMTPTQARRSSGQ